MTDPSSRLLTLLSLLQVPRDWPGDALADRLAVSPRTVRRDVDRLRALGYRVDALRGPAGGYRLAAGTTMPPLLLDDEQAVALALALAVAPASGADVATATARALTVVRQVMPEPLRRRTEAISVATRPGTVAVDPEVLVTVGEAVRARHVLRLDLVPPPGRSDDPDGTLRPPRRVEPHALVARRGRWYLLAREQGVDDWRTYRVDRLRLRAPTRLPFTPRPVPGGDAAAFVDGLFRGAADPGASDAWPCTGTVVLRAPLARVAPFVGDDAVVEDVDGDSCRATLGSWSWTGLAARVAGLDAPFEVVRPEELRSAVGALGERLRGAADGP